MNLTLQQTDLLKELINIGAGKAAGLINQMVGVHVRLELPELIVVPPGETPDFAGRGFEEVLSAVRLGFRGAFTGWTGLVFSRNSANWLVSQLLGQVDTPPMDLDSLRIGAIQEVGNIVLNGVMGSIVNVLGENVGYFPPDYFESGIQDILTSGNASERVVLLIKARFRLEDGVADGDILIFFSMDTFESLVRSLDRLLAQAGA
ncbi:CheY-P phosphatase CheC [Fundidesulfovibrio magnetotacticus]|uniref:CheY-P phosphatase CheC n=1 Tax=Fundidesulfovibrio magnetotacticus TaxID=2730080 RepID=A0A6V8LL12_9BACT|nr:chemotaxis protein CheC [Fundidesulfovibrio magnetotacticus]GFK93383.1 CheY-P phosphatase CheC [Fundidesulfovibrio magnetotacticus]